MFDVPAEAYERFVGRYSTDLAVALLDFAGVEAGRALDVGAGTGKLTEQLARRLGPEHVSAVDPSEPFAQACRERVPGADVRLGVAGDLPFGDSSFDAVLAQLVLNFIPDAGRAVSEMIRVAKPGATLAACVWDLTGGMRMLVAFGEAARATDPAAPDERVPMCADGALARLWTGAGLRDVRSGALEVRAAYRDFDDLWQPFTQGPGPAGAYTKSLPPDRQARLRDAFRERLGVGEDPFELTARAWAVAGTR